MKNIKLRWWDGWISIEVMAWDDEIYIFVDAKLELELHGNAVRFWMENFIIIEFFDFFGMGVDQLQVISDRSGSKM